MVGFSKVLPVKGLDWLRTEAGERVIAIGLVAISFSLVAFIFHDVWILFTGNLPELSLGGIWYLFLGGLATLFSAICVIVWRPAWARLLIALFSVSMASHILERFVRIPIPQLRMIAVCRLLVSLGIVLVFLRYRSNDRDTATG